MFWCGGKENIATVFVTKFELLFVMTPVYFKKCED